MTAPFFFFFSLVHRKEGEKLSRYEGTGMCPVPGASPRQSGHNNRGCLTGPKRSAEFSDGGASGSSGTIRPQ